MHTMLKLYENIRLYRKQAKLTQDELAKLAGYTDRSSIAKIEKGLVDLSQTKIKQFADIFGVTPSTLMGWDEKIEKNPVEMAERHFEMIMDEDLNDIFDDIKWLDARERKMVKDLAHALAENKKNGSLIASEHPRNESK